MQITAWVAVFAVPQLFFMSAIFETGQIEAIKNASSITPVPGGVGPMTIACLLLNTLIATCEQNNIEFSTLGF